MYKIGDLIKIKRKFNPNSYGPRFLKDDININNLFQIVNITNGNYFVLDLNNNTKHEIIGDDRFYGNKERLKRIKRNMTLNKLLGDSDI